MRDLGWLLLVGGLGSTLLLCGVLIGITVGR